MGVGFCSEEGEGGRSDQKKAPPCRLNRQTFYLRPLESGTISGKKGTQRPVRRTRGFPLREARARRDDDSRGSIC